MDYPRINRRFAQACFALPPIAGSLTSIVWHGGAIWCLWLIASRREPLSRDRTMWTLTGLLYAYVAASVASALVNGLELHQAEDLVRLATPLLFPFSYSLFAIARKREIADSAAIAAAVGCAGGAVIALLQFIATDMRPEGGAGNALVFATVCCLGGITCLAGALTLRSALQGWLLAGYGAAWIGMILAGGRSVWLAAAVITAVMLIASRRRIRTLFGRHAAATVGCVLAGAILLSGVLVSRVELLVADWETLTEQNSYDTSLGVRVLLWNHAIELIRERPLLGYGIQNTKALVQQAAHDADLSVRTFTHFHNGYLTIAVQSGIFGLIPLVAVMVVAAVAALRALKNDNDAPSRFGALVLLGGVLTYAIGGTFNLILGHDILDTCLMIVLITGAWLACGTERAPGMDDTALRQETGPEAQRDEPSSPASVPR